MATEKQLTALEKLIEKYQERVDYLQSIKVTEYGESSLSNCKIFIEDLKALTPPAVAAQGVTDEEQNVMMSDAWRKIFAAENSGNLPEEIRAAIAYAENREIITLEDFSSNCLLIEAATRYLETLANKAATAPIACADKGE